MSVFLLHSSDLADLEEHLSISCDPMLTAPNAAVITEAECKAAAAETLTLPHMLLHMEMSGRAQIFNDEQNIKMRTVRLKMQTHG